jgi:hypothetical protein
MSVNITKYIGQIKELERLTGAKFTGTEPNPNSKANSEQYAVFTHQELKQPKKVGLHYLNDRIRAVKNGYNIFTANSKSNQQLNNVHSSLLSKQELISTQNPSKKCLLSKLIFKASAITKTDTH